MSLVFAGPTFKSPTGALLGRSMVVMTGGIESIRGTTGSDGY